VISPPAPRRQSGQPDIRTIFPPPSGNQAPGAESRSDHSPRRSSCCGPRRRVRTEHAPMHSCGLACGVDVHTGSTHNGSVKHSNARAAPIIPRCTARGLAGDQSPGCFCSPGAALRYRAWCRPPGRADQLNRNARHEDRRFVGWPRSPACSAIRLLPGVSHHLLY